MIGDRRDLALLLVRIVMGLIFILYGWKHIAGLEGYTGFFAFLNIPLPEFVAPFVAWLEFLGGIAILTGIFTRYSGILLAITMLVAIVMYKFGAATVEPEDFLNLGLANNSSPSWNVELMLLTMGLTMFFMGPGKMSLEVAMFKKEL
jgi:putative oxidoreductase